VRADNDDIFVNVPDEYCPQAPPKKQRDKRSKDMRVFRFWGRVNL
jgi:hypothetical protein